MRLRKALSIFCILLAAIFALISCAPISQQQNTAKTTITIAASKSLESSISALAESFNNSQSRYEVKAVFFDSSELLEYYFEHGAIDPDLVVYENIDSVNKHYNYLQQLNRFESVSKYQVSILNSLKTIEGELFALPAPGSIYMQCFNAEMFSAVNINDSDYPQTLQGSSDGGGDLGMLNIAENLGEYCRKDSSKIAYVSEAGELSMVYTLMEIAVPIFASSTAGIDFVKKYYRNQNSTSIASSAYKQKWEEILDTFRTLYTDGYYSVDNLNLESGEAIEKFVNGEAYVYASVPGSDLETAYKESDASFNMVMYPFVGETSNQKWIISKPNFYIGVSKSAYNDSQRGTADGITEFLEYFSSDDGRKLAANNKNESIYYATDTDVNLTGIFRYLNEPINQNKIYLCDQFISVFSVATDILKNFVSDSTITIDSAIAQIDSVVAASAPGNKVVYTSQAEFDYPDGGLVSETAIGNYVADALKKAANTESVIVTADVVNCNIFAGSLDDDCLAVVFDGSTTLMPARITIGGVKKILSDCSQNGVFPLISGIKLGDSNGEITISLVGSILSDSDTVLVLLPQEWITEYSEFITVNSYGIYSTPLELMTSYLNRSDVNRVLKMPAKDGRYGNYSINKSS